MEEGHIEIWDEDVLLQLTSSMEKLKKPRRMEEWQKVSKILLHESNPLPFNRKLYARFSKYFTGNHAWECLRFRWLVEQGNVKEVEEGLESVAKSQRVKILLYLSKVCFERNVLHLSLVYAEQAYVIESNNMQVLRRLVALHHRIGNISQKEHFLRQIKAQSGFLYSNELECAYDEKLLLNREWQWNCTKAEIERGNTLIHIWNKSYPETNGYTVRSMDIIKHQHERGYRVSAVTKLGWPSDTRSSDWIQAVHDDIDHYHLYDANQTKLNKVPMSEYFQVYADRFAELLQRLQPKVIHAASNFQNALPPLAVAEKLGIPSVYEVRGLWHYTQSSKTEKFEQSERFRLHERYELICCQLADRVVVICDSLKSHLIERGVPSHKIHVIYNGVNVSDFRPQPPCPELMKEYGLKGKLVIGFIGSVETYEGLDALLYALALLRKQRSDIRLLIVGDGSALYDLQKLSRALGLSDIVRFVGRVPRKEIQRFYSVMDVCAYPRTLDKVCELVTPLKPYEAMAMGKAVLVSDIPALREMVVEGKTGMIFQSENAGSLAECLNQSHRFPELGRKARQWVVQNRDWKQLIKKYEEVYDI